MFARTAFLATALLISTAAVAQYAEDFGAYRVRYSALPTDQLLPEVARSYGIVRSRQRCLVNIAVQRTASGDASAPMRATLSGTATSLTGDRVPLRFREIAEEGAVYYISELAITTPSTYRFAIDVTPESATAPYVLRFNQDFVSD